MTSTMVISPPIPSSALFGWSPPAQDPTIKYTPQRTYNVEFTKGEKGWIVVRCRDLPGLNTQGRDEKEAVKNSIEAIELYEEEIGRDKEFNLNIQYKFSG
jgi:predicted RNase H-like HicB family nuclease